MEQPMRERRAPLGADALRAEDHVAERAWNALGELVASVDRKRKDICRLVDHEGLALQLPHLFEPAEPGAELALGDALGAQHGARNFARSRLVDLEAAAIVDLDREHQRLR